MKEITEIDPVYNTKFVKVVDGEKLISVSITQSGSGYIPTPEDEERIKKIEEVRKKRLIVTERNL